MSLFKSSPGCFNDDFLAIEKNILFIRMGFLLSSWVSPSEEKYFRFFHMCSQAKTCFCQVRDFANRVFKTFQSTFQNKYDRETPFIKTVNNLTLNIEEKKSSVSVLPELSAAFDTGDYILYTPQPGQLL